MPCVIANKKGECRWEKDGSPVGMYPTKYEWAGAPEKGDCSLRVLDASLEYDDGVWQCQVTPSSFQTKDSLISEGAELVVRGKVAHQIAPRLPKLLYREENESGEIWIFLQHILLSEFQVAHQVVLQEISFRDPYSCHVERMPDGLKVFSLAH